MIKVDFPAPAFQIKEEDGKDILFDALRKQWVRLTPEEWVRQNMIQYLIQTKNYPSALIAIEKELKLGELKKRFDVLIYDNNHEPWMMIECKAMEVELHQKVLEQLMRYHISVPVPYLVISNGSYTYAWQKKDNRLFSLDQFPVYDGTGL